MSVQRSYLKSRVINAGSWSVAGYAASFAIRLGSNLIMTRLLLPEMFGVMGIAYLVLSGLALFSDLGLKPSVVQSKRGHEPDFLNTVWAVQIVRGCVLWLASIPVSVAIAAVARFDLVPKASVYQQEELPYVVVAVAITAIFSGFESTKILEAGRNLTLRRITTIDLASQACGLVVMVVWAAIDRSIWALVVGALAASMIRTVASHVALPGTSNRWLWERGALDEILRFGKWIFLSSLLFFFASNGDRIVLGALVGARELGAYVIALVMVSAIDQLLTKVIVDVSFPALSEVIRLRPRDLGRTYYKFHAIIAPLTYAGSGFLFIAGQEIVNVLYDARYQQAGWILQVLAVALLSIPFRMATQAFLALGIERLYFVLHAIRIVSLFAGLWLGYHVAGFEGAVWGVVVSNFANLPLTIIIAKQRGMFELRKEVIALLAVLPGAAVGWGFTLLVSLFRH